MPKAVSFAPVRTVRAYEGIVRQVEERIAAGDLRPGDRLPSERELTTQFDVSRSTVREALRVLESSGLVRSRPGDPLGPQVIASTASAMRKLFARVVDSRRLGVAELLQFRMIIESAAGSVAARQASPSELDELEQALAGMRDAVADGYEAFSTADVRFHEHVARLSGNELLVLCLDAVRSMVLDLISTKLAEAPDREALMERTLAHHRRVIDAMRAGEADEVARLTRQELHHYYAEYVPEARRSMVDVLL
ncbi:FadR family transcriptional regulator [Micromonospora aurantiaca]|nr:FadR family transcriptional regulator [Micromonospora aurantiaca]